MGVRMLATEQPASPEFWGKPVFPQNFPRISQFPLNFLNIFIKSVKIMQSPPNLPDFLLKLLKIVRFENNTSPNFPRKTAFLHEFYPNSGANFTLVAALYNTIHSVNQYGLM